MGGEQGSLGHFGLSLGLGGWREHAQHLASLCTGQLQPPLQKHKGQCGRAGQTLPRPSLSPWPPFSLSSSLAIHSLAQTTFLNRDLRRSGGSWSFRDSTTAWGSAGNSDSGSGCRGDALTRAPVCQHGLMLPGLLASTDFHESCLKASLACSELQGLSPGFPWLELG